MGLFVLCIIVIIIVAIRYSNKKEEQRQIQLAKKELERKKTEKGKRRLEEHKQEEKLPTKLAKKNFEREKVEEERKRQSELVKYKLDRELIINVLSNNDINCFYHFTPSVNLEYIKKYGGLYSWWSLKEKNIEVPIMGGEGFGQDLDFKFGLQDYVRLSFCEDHPMQYKFKKDNIPLILLKVDTEVATWRNTLFSDINATDSGHQCGGTYEDLQRVDFSAIKKRYVSRDDPDFKPHQAEILVKTFIPIKFIVNIDNPIKL